MLLGLNIDHIATLRQARYRDAPFAELAEPVLLDAARRALEAGADSLTLHTRADGRHVQCEDAQRIKEQLPEAKLNLELGLDERIVDFALSLAPHYACIVPEGRQEVTTEGGLELTGDFERVEAACLALENVGTKVSLFLDPEPEQVRAAANSSAKRIELHTGAFANARSLAERERELARLIEAATLAKSLGLRVHAGHGLRLDNLPSLAAVPHLCELNIGHSTISRALFVGLDAAVRELRQAIDAIDWQ